MDWLKMGKPKKNRQRDSISSIGFNTSFKENSDDFDDVDIGNFSYRTTASIYYPIKFFGMFLLKYPSTKIITFSLLL